MRNLDQAYNYFTEGKNENEYYELPNGKKILIKHYAKMQQDNHYFKYITEKLVIDDICWEQDFESLYNALNEYKIKEFILADESTALMSTLNFFLDKGAKITGNEVYKTEKRFGIATEYKGLVITL